MVCILLFVGVWNHSDFCLINPATRGIVMLGRRCVSRCILDERCSFLSSDGTLNPNGIRFGSAEIYSIVDQFNGEIVDSLCVAQRNPVTGNERVILFLKVSARKRRDTRVDEYSIFILRRRETRSID